MKVTIVDYNSGNISSVINSFEEVAKDKVNIEVTSIVTLSLATSLKEFITELILPDL